MITRILSICLLVFGLQAGSVFSQNQDTSAIHKVFTKYIDYAKESEGSKLVELVSESTIDFYADMLYHTRFSKKKALQELGLVELLTVLMARHTGDKEFIRSMGSDGEMFLSYLVDDGMVKPKDNLEMGEIEFDEALAKVQVIHKGKPIPRNLMSFKFFWEDGAWKLDIMSILNNAMVKYALSQMLKETEMEKLEFIYFTLQYSSGDEVDKKKLWKPIK